MRARRVSAIAVSGLVSAGVLAPLEARADASATVYVGDYPKGVFAQCSDTAPDAGSVTTPFCTVPKALASSSVVSGTTLSLSGMFTGDVDIAKSGVTLAGDPAFRPLLEGGVTISGQHDVTLRGLTITDASAEAVKVSWAQHVTLDDVSAIDAQSGDHTVGDVSAAEVRFDGVTDSVITKSRVSGSRAGGIIIDADSVHGVASTRDVVSDTVVAANGAGGVSVVGSTAIDIVADTVDGNCGTGVAISGGAADVRVENDIVSNGRACKTLPGVGISADAATVASGSTVVGYDIVTSADPAAPVVSWGGAAYADAAAFDAANVGTGSHDLTADPKFVDDSAAGSWLRNSYALTAASPAVDSADSSVRNQPGTDHDGQARQWDPDIATTGAGSPAWADRGAYEYQVPLPSTEIALRRDGNISDYLNVTATVLTDPKWPIASYVIDFGDGHKTTSTSPALPVHAYAAPGDYTVTATLTDTVGRSWTAQQAISMHPDPVAPKFSVDTGTADPALRLPAQWLTSASIDFGDGSAPTAVTGDFNQPQTVQHHFPTSGHYTITVTGTDPEGFSGSTSQSVDILTYDADRTVHRVAGTDRYATAIAASQTHWAAGSAGAVVLASGADYPDALAGGPLAAHVGGPLLLTDPHTLNAGTVAEIVRALGAGGPGAPKTVYVLGGTSAVSDAVLRALPASVKVQRVGGQDRFDTARQVAQLIGPSSQVVVASGLNFADALAAGPLAVKDHAAILLSDGARLDAATAAEIGRHASVTAVGGPAAAAVRAGVNLSGKSFTDLHGADRYGTAAAVVDAYDAGAVPASFALASGANFPDALAGGALAAVEGEPLLLTDPKALSWYVDNDLEHWHLFEVRGTVQVFGGPNAVGDAVVAQVREDTGGVID